MNEIFTKSNGGCSAKNIKIRNYEKYVLTIASFYATLVVFFNMTIHNEGQLQRIEDCRELYLKHGGRRHGDIEREMRALGHTDFHRRILYSRFERGHHRAGWIERYGFGTGAQASRLQGRDSGLTPSPTAPVTPPKGGGVAGGDACAPGDFDEFQSWLKSVSPSMTWSWKHQVYIYKRLRRVTG